MTVRARLLLLGALLCAACMPASVANAAGPPLPSSASGKAGAVAPGGHERLITRGAGPEETLVLAVRRSDREVLRSRRIGGRWRIAPATLAGGTTGLSADGRTLAVVRPVGGNFPPADTHLAVLDARELVVRRQISLPGFFTLDAISPDGRWLYLIQYGDGNVLDYRVRALDARTGRLAARDIVDPREPDEQMGGLPMRRVTSRDGRWVYTLYGGGGEVFIHALDTVGRTAACIDLEMLSSDSDLTAVRLRASHDGRRIGVRDDGSLVATVNTRTFEVREPGGTSEGDPSSQVASRTATVTPADDDFPWLVVILAGGLAALAVLFARRPLFKRE
jgi:hypothetical protein